MPKLVENKKIAGGKFNLRDKFRSGRRPVIDDNVLKNLVRENQRQTTVKKNYLQYFSVLNTQTINPDNKNSCEYELLNT